MYLQRIKSNKGKPALSNSWILSIYITLGCIFNHIFWAKNRNSTNEIIDKGCCCFSFFICLWQKVIFHVLFNN